MSDPTDPITNLRAAYRILEDRVNTVLQTHRWEPQSLQLTYNAAIALNQALEQVSIQLL
jgi:hypothetical protein